MLSMSETIKCECGGDLTLNETAWNENFYQCNYCLETWAYSYIKFHERKTIKK